MAAIEPTGSSPVALEVHDTEALVARDVGYSVPVKGRKGAKDTTLTLLQGITLTAPSGSMTAIMGSSGSGKTTLMDVMAGRKTTGAVSGTVCVVAGGSGPKGIPSSLAYVTQDDVFAAVLTVRETLRFAAELRLPGLTAAERAERIDELVAMLSLGRCLDNRVGSAMLRGVSGGERKRLAIAVEMVTLPQLIFLDEPTSGLDSLNALELVKAMRSLTDTGSRTVLATIHQPSVEAFRLFDQLVLLDRGRPLYVGPTAGAVAALSASSELEFDAQSNPADFVLRVACSDAAPAVADAFAASEAAAVVTARADALIAGRAVAAADPAPPKSGGALQEFRVLARRTRVVSHRDPALVRAAVGSKVVVSLFISSLYFDLDVSQAQDLYALMGVLFFSIIFFLIGNLLSIASFMEERLLFYRERASGAYSTLPYYMAATVSFLPPLAVSTLLFDCILYPIVGLDASGDKFAFYVLLTFAINLLSFSFSQLLAAACKSAMLALALFPATFVFMLLHAGFLIQVPAEPIGWRVWAPYVSFARWSFQGLVTNELEGQCVGGPPGACLTAEEFLCPYGFTSAHGDDCDEDPGELFGKWWCLLIVCVSIAVVRTATFVALKYKSFEER